MRRIGDWFGRGRAAAEGSAEAWLTQRRAELRRLPPAAAELGRVLLGPPGEPATPPGRLDLAGREGLPVTSAADRAALWRLLCPRCATTVEAAWQLFPELGRWHDLLLRLPAGEALLETQRLVWLARLLRLIGPAELDMPALAALELPPADDHYHAGGSVAGLLLGAALAAGGPVGMAAAELLDRRVARGGLLCGAVLVAWAVGGQDAHLAALLATLRAPDTADAVRQQVLTAAALGRLAVQRQVWQAAVDEDRLPAVWWDNGGLHLLGLQQAALPARQRPAALGRALQHLGDPAAAQRARSSGSAADCWLALVAGGWHDGAATATAAVGLLTAQDPARRYAAVRWLAASGLPASVAALVEAVGDPDLRIACCAARAASWVLAQRPVAEPLVAQVERLRAEVGVPPRAGSGWRDPQMALAGATRAELAARLLARLPALQAQQPAQGSLGPWLVFPGWLEVCTRQAVAEWIQQLGEQLLPTTLAASLTAPHLTTASLAADPALRRAELAKLVRGDRSARTAAAALLRGLPLGADEVTVLSEALRRDGSLEARQLLATAPPALLRAAAPAWLADRSRRTATVELLARLAGGSPGDPTARALLAAWAGRQTSLDAVERQCLAALEISPPPPAATESGQPLPVAPQAVSPPLWSPAAEALARLLLDCFDSLAGAARADGDDGQPGQVAVWPALRLDDYTLREPLDAADLPLAERWLAAYRGRPDAARDADGCELLRVACDPRLPGGWHPRHFAGDQATDYALTTALQSLCTWLLALDQPTSSADWLLAAFEAACAATFARSGPGDPAAAATLQRVLGGLQRYRVVQPDDWPAGRQTRFWQTLAWAAGESYQRGGVEVRPTARDIANGYAAGVIGRAAVLEHLRGPGPLAAPDHLAGRLLQLPPHGPAADEGLQRLLDEVRADLLTAELDGSAEPSERLDALRRSVGFRGTGVLCRLLEALRKQKLRPDLYSGATARRSRWVVAVWPLPEETPEISAERLRVSSQTVARWLEVAVLAPQWAPAIERLLDWPALESAVWWLLAHSRSFEDPYQDDELAAWDAGCAPFGTLSGEARRGGAIDAAWFRQCYAALGEARWEQLVAVSGRVGEPAARQAALLAADVLRGRVEPASLTARLAGRPQAADLVALGLLPVPNQAAAASRYQVLEAARRAVGKAAGARRYGLLAAVELGLQYLAVSAGYGTVERLRWGLEAAAGDLLRDPPTLTSAGAVVTVALVAGLPQLEVRRDGRMLRRVPAELAKDPAVVALRTQVAALRAQVEQFPEILERALLLQQIFGGAELTALLAHPLLSPPLRALLWSTPAGPAQLLEAHDGPRLQTAEGVPQALASNVQLRLIHPLDLSASDLARWRERLGPQPLRQLDRPTFGLTAAEQEGCLELRRYRGHPLAAAGLLAAARREGWAYYGDSGLSWTREGLGVLLIVTFDDLLPPWASAATCQVESVKFRAGRTTPRCGDLPPRLRSELLYALHRLVTALLNGPGVAHPLPLTAAERAEWVARTTVDLPPVTLDGTTVRVSGQHNQYRLELTDGSLRGRRGQELDLAPHEAAWPPTVTLPADLTADPPTARLLLTILRLAHDHQVREPWLQHALARG
ncbi:MAG: DUF4132 domain-containing protein [Fimbriimonadaceae bacterium]|nr:DUF4132 domain-containing protein [Fimbriimonadaceae bacterium]